MQDFEKMENTVKAELPEYKQKRILNKNNGKTA